MSNTLHTLFQFESPYKSSLQYIPMSVRLKLDLVGIKLKLDQWLKISQEERFSLLNHPCETFDEKKDFEECLVSIAKEKIKESLKKIEPVVNPPWEDLSKSPKDLTEKLKKEGFSMTLDQWKSLSVLERFTLCKLSRPGSKSDNFISAAQEFKLKF